MPEPIITYETERYYLDAIRTSLDTIRAEISSLHNLAIQHLVDHSIAEKDARKKPPKPKPSPKPRATAKKKGGNK